jgi:ribosomal-protein-alanine N-acetyltransferase
VALHGVTEATDRLLLRVPRLADAEALMGVFGDRDAMRYTLHFANLRDCRRHIAAHHCQRGKKGFGPWTVVDKVSGQIIGFGGLLDDPFDPAWGIEVAYHFAPAAWGRGCATELTNHSVRVASERLRVPRGECLHASRQRCLATCAGKGRF